MCGAVVEFGARAERARGSGTCVCGTMAMMVVVRVVAVALVLFSRTRRCSSSTHTLATLTAPPHQLSPRTLATDPFISSPSLVRSQAHSLAVGLTLSRSMETVRALARSLARACAVVACCLPQGVFWCARA